MFLRNVRNLIGCKNLITTYTKQAGLTSSRNLIGVKNLITRYTNTQH